ncbi:hypothetical protein BASA81_010755 [Batrachochytrium salamandrivorans]|nr:hypothetical protein BASA81_010755 [Batrachochytrium salamandrivorans]
MSSHVENALKRATELIDVGQKSQALRDLSDMIERERRQYRRQWSKTLEDSVLLLVRLSCELRDNTYIKNTLSSYRHMAQVQAPGSLELVIKEMLDLSEDRVAKALAQCGKAGANIEDLDLDEQEIVQDKLAQRSEQAILIPWLKFAWENLRNVLDILRNNQGLEQSYHATAHRAFKFCQTYSRKLEFRRLCELLRTHLSMQTKFAQQAAQQQLVDGGQAVELLPTFKLSGESMELHLQTRLEQLRVATALHLWVEGFKSIEDISQIVNLGARKPSAQLMATYYAKLAVMFLASGSFLFHALALRSHYDLNRERNKSLTKVQIESMASSTLLAALAVPLLNAETQVLEKEKNRRMSVLCGFEFNPDRDSLLAQLRASRVLEDCSNEVKSLFYALEGYPGEAEFDPQTLVQRLAPHIKWVRQDVKLEPYAQNLDHLLLLRLMGQFSQVFSTIQLNHLHDQVKLLAELSQGGLTALEAEVLIVRAIRHKQLSNAIKIDHGLQLLRFTNHPLDHVQTKQCLKDLAVGLTLAVAPLTVTTKVEENEHDLLQVIEREALELETRKQVIIQRKLEISTLAVFREKQRVEREEQARQERLEQERLWVQKIAQEEAQRVLERVEKERIQQQIELDLKLNGIDTRTLDRTTTEFLSVQDKERLIREKQEKQQNQALEAEKRIQSKTKRFDFLVRAARDAERPKLIKLEQEHQIQEKQDEQQASSQRLEEAQQLITQKLQTKQELDQAFVPTVVDQFLAFSEKSMREQYLLVVRHQREQEYHRKLDAKLERAEQRRNEAARMRKQAMEDNREQQRLEEDARKRDAKLLQQQQH